MSDPTSIEVISQSLPQRLAQLEAENAALRQERDAARGEVTLLRGLMAQDDQRLVEAADKAGVPPMGCDTADHLAECVLELRAERDALRADLARARDNYTDLAELLFGEAEYEHEDAHRRLAEILADLARARAVLDTAQDEGVVTNYFDGTAKQYQWLLVDRAAWLAWQEAKR